VLKYLHEQGCPWHDIVCESVAWGDDLEQLKWLHAHGAVLDNRAVESAAQNGAVHVFEWLQQQQGIEFTEHSMAYAALNGHLQLCQWLRAQQCSWCAIAPHVAASANHLDTMRWLIENGCPYGEVQTLCDAAAEGCRDTDLSILQYLYDSGIMAGPAVLEAVLNTYAARKHSSLVIAKWLKDRCAQWPAVLADQHDRSWTAEMLAWARAEGCTSSTEFEEWD
jgi:Ankyrin repeats (3 copies)